VLQKVFKNTLEILLE